MPIMSMSNCYSGNWYCDSSAKAPDLEVMTKAVAIALNPVTVVDIQLGCIDVALILTLSKLYGIK